VSIAKPKRKRLKKRRVPKPDGRYLIYFEKQSAGPNLPAPGA